jgi:hypothetical protein
MTKEIPLSKLVKLGGDHAHACLIGLRRPLMPTWLYIDRDHGIHIVGTPWRDEAEKRIAGAHMLSLLRKAGALAYSVVVEAWVSKQAKDWEPGQPCQEPRLDPEHQEIVLAFATDGEATEWRQWDIIRDWNDIVIKLEEQPMGDGAQMTSWMNKLLAKRRAA